MQAEQLGVFVPKRYPGLHFKQFPDASVQLSHSVPHF